MHISNEDLIILLNIDFGFIKKIKKYWQLIIFILIVINSYQNYILRVILLNCIVL